MYQNLTLYYLNQMGIVPWINKKNGVKGGDASKKLVIILSADQNDKGRILLKQMLTFINRAENELLIITIDPINSTDNLSKAWQSQLTEKTLLAIFIMGLDACELLSNLNLNCPIITGPSLDSLLANPSCKKNVFKDLGYLKQLDNNG